MTILKFYDTEIASISLHLPIIEVKPGVKVPIFNMLGKSHITKVAANALVEKLHGLPVEGLVTAEAKSIPLAHEMSALINIPYVVFRKSYKTYMGEALTAESKTLTTAGLQKLYLDQNDQKVIRNKLILILDDVINSGSTIEAMQKLVVAAGGKVIKIASVFTEGDKDWSHVISLGHLPIFTVKP